MWYMLKCILLKLWYEETHKISAWKKESPESPDAFKLSEYIVTKKACVNIQSEVCMESGVF